MHKIFKSTSWKKNSADWSITDSPLPLKYCRHHNQTTPIHKLIYTSQYTRSTMRWMNNDEKYAENTKGSTELFSKEIQIGRSEWVSTEIFFMLACFIWFFFLSMFCQFAFSLMWTILFFLCFYQSHAEIFGNRSEN